MVSYIPSVVSQKAYKYQQVFVYTPDGQTFIDVLRDAPLLAGFKETLSSGTSPMRVKLPRSFDFYDQAGIIGSRGTIAQGNIVKYYLFGPTLPTNGLLRFQGFIDTIEPEIADSGEESVTITLVPFSSVLGDHGITQDIEFGQSNTSSTYVDPIAMFYYFFINNDIVTGKPYMYPCTWDPNNVSSTGVKAHYKFSNQLMNSIFDSILLMLPANWYYRINPDNSVTISVPHTTPDHTLYVGKNISNPQYRLDWSNLKNVVVYKGGNTNGVISGTTTGAVNPGGSIFNGKSSGNVTGSISNGSIQNGSISGGSFSGSGSTTGSGSFGVTVFGSVFIGSVPSSASFSASGNSSVSIPVSMSVSGGVSGSVTGGVSGGVSGTFSGSATGEPRGNISGTTTITTVPMQVVKSGNTLNTFGERIVYQNESRVIDTNTLGILALGLLTQLNRQTIRTKVRIPDVSGFTGMGYPIDSMKVGDTVLVIDPTAPNSQKDTLWDQALWDQDAWDFKIGVDLNTSLFDHVLPIVALDYGFDYVDIELDSLMPNLSRALFTVQQEFNDFTMGIAVTNNATAAQSNTG